MAKSLLLNFLEMIGTMSINPEQGEAKVNDLKELLINFHHVLNEYRPHQARESLILLMQDQLDKKRAETHAIRVATENAKKTIEALADVDNVASDDAGFVTAAGAASLNGHTDMGFDAATWTHQEPRWDGLDEAFG
jgi:mediator of RNA polymerase II transcription subunit 7